MMRQLFLLGFNFFCLETKIQDLDLFAKNNSCSLKILNLRESIIAESVLSPCRASDNRIFLTFTGVIFLTLQVPISLLSLCLIKISASLCEAEILYYNQIRTAFQEFLLQ